MPEAVVKFDKYRYLDEDGTVVTASRGDTIDVSKDELDRGLASGGLATGKEKSAAQMSGAELDAKAEELGVDDWDASARVADKKTTLQAWIDAHPDA